MKDLKQVLYEVILKLWPLVYGEPKKDGEVTAQDGPGTNPTPPPPPPPPGN